MATFRSGVKILGHISKTKGHGGAPFRSRSCDRRTLFSVQTRQESAFIVQDSCEDSLKETQRSHSWLSIFSRNRSPDSAAEDENKLKKDDESWFSYFSKKPLQVNVNEKKPTSTAVDKDHEKCILRENKGEKGVNRTVCSDILKENASSSISKCAVCHLHKGANIMSPRSTVVQPLSREIALAYSRNGFHSIPPNSYIKDKITILKKHVSNTQKSTDINYSSMVTQNLEASASLPYTASDVQNLLLMSVPKSSFGCANPHLFVNSEIKRSSCKGTSQDKTNITDFGSQNSQLHSSTSKLKSKTSIISTMKQKGSMKQQYSGLPQHKLQSQSSLSNAYVDKVDHKILYSDSSSAVPVNNERQKREREAFLKTKALISMKPIVSTHNNKTPSGKQVLQGNSYSANDLLKYSSLKLSIKPKGKALDKFTDPYILEAKPKAQKSKYISDSPLIKQKSHPTQFVVHPSMIANSSIPLRLSSSTANTSEKYPSVFEESKIYQNELKGPITTLSSLIDKIDATAEHSHVAQNLRNQVIAKKLDMDNMLRHENLAEQEHFMHMTQAAKTENDDSTNVPCEYQANAEIQSCSTQETTTELNSKIVMEHNHTKQNGCNNIVSEDCSQESNDVHSANTNTNTAEEIMLEKKHKYHDDLNENMRSKFGMHMPYFKNQNNILALKKSKSNKINKNESLNLNKQKDAAKPLLWTSPKLAKHKEDNISEVYEEEKDKYHNSETSKASPQTVVEEECTKQKTEVLSDMSKSFDPKVVATSVDGSNKSDKNIDNECVSSTNETEKSESASEELPELTLQADYGPNEDNVEIHQQVPLEKQTPSLRRHKYFPNYFSKRSFSSYTDPPAFGEKLEIHFCPGNEKGSAGDKCKKIGTKDEKDNKTKSCNKVTEPGCEPAKHTLCTPPLPSDECHKRMSPAPSYSECMKPPIPPKAFRECNPVKDLECPAHKQQKDYDACKHQPQENVCAGSDKKKKQGDDEIHKIDSTCPDATEYCSEPYKGQKTMAYPRSPMKCLSRTFSNYAFQNDTSNRFYSTFEDENPLLSNRNSPKVYPKPMISQTLFYHNKVECKGGSKESRAPSSDKSCKKLGKKEDRKKKQTCVKVTQEGCVVPKSTLCVPPTNFEKCNKALAPKPSYSECMRSVEIPPRPFTECDPTVDLECPTKKRKNYDACHPTKKAESACSSGKNEKKTTQWKDNTCPKEEECPPPFGGKKANTGYSKVAIKCPSLSKTAAYLPPRRYFSCASGRYILKCYSSLALDSSSLYNEEIIHNPFIVAQHMKNNRQQPSHERNTQKGKPFVTLSASYCSSPIFLDYMAFKILYKLKNDSTLNTNFLPKIASDSIKVNKISQCIDSKMAKGKKEAAKRIGIISMEMDRLSEKAIVLNKHRLSGSYGPKTKCLTYSCLLHNTQDMVSKRSYCTWSTIKQSTKRALQKKDIIRQCSSFKKNSGNSDSLNEPCPFHSEKKIKKKDNKCEREGGEKPFNDCPAPNKEKLARCPPPKKMKVVAPPKPVKVVSTVLDCPKPPQKVQRKCEAELPPPPPPPPPPEKPLETYTECPKPQPKTKVVCAEEVKEKEVVEVPGVCKNTDQAPNFTQCPKPKPKLRRKCEEYEPLSEPCTNGKKKQRPESPSNSTKTKCSGISSQFIFSPIVPHSTCTPINFSWPKVRFYYKLARCYSIKSDKTSVMVGRLCFVDFSFWQEIANNHKVKKLQYKQNNPKTASSITNLRNLCSKANVNVVLHFLSKMKPAFSFLKLDCYPELPLKQFAFKYAVAHSEKRTQTSPFYNQYKYINESRNEHSIISPKRVPSKKQKQPPSFSEYMHLKSKSQRHSGKNRSSASKMKKQQSSNSMNTTVNKEKKRIPCLKLSILSSVKSISPIINSSPNTSNESTSKSSPILLPPPKSSTSSTSPPPATSTVTETQSTHSASKAQEKSLSSKSSPTSSSCLPSFPEASPTQTPLLPQSAPSQLSTLSVTDKNSSNPLSLHTQSSASSPTEQLPATQTPTSVASSPTSRIAPPLNSHSSTLQSSSVKSGSLRAPSSLSKCSPLSLAQGLSSPTSSSSSPPPPPPSPPRPTITCSPKSPKSLQFSKAPSSLAKKCACLLPDIICKILAKENTLEVCRKKKCSREDF